MKKILSVVAILFAVAFTSQAEVVDNKIDYQVVYDIGSDATVVAFNSTAIINPSPQSAIKVANSKNLGGFDSTVIVNVISNNPATTNSYLDYVLKYVSNELLSSFNKDKSPSSNSTFDKNIKSNVGKLTNTSC